MRYLIHLWALSVLLPNVWTASDHAHRPGPHSGHTHLALERAKIPQLLHQSWKSEDLPSPAESWRQSMLDQNAGWQLVHWTDNDNAALVQTHAPWLQDVYDKLHGVYRADLVSCCRNYHHTTASNNANSHFCLYELHALAPTVHHLHQGLAAETQHAQHQSELHKEWVQLVSLPAGAPIVHVAVWRRVCRS